NPGVRLALERLAFGRYLEKWRALVFRFLKEFVRPAGRKFIRKPLHALATGGRLPGDLRHGEWTKQREASHEAERTAAPTGDEPCLLAEGPYLEEALGHFEHQNGDRLCLAPRPSAHLGPCRADAIASQHRHSRTKSVDTHPRPASGNPDPLRRRRARGDVSGAAVRRRLSGLQGPRERLAVAVGQERCPCSAGPTRWEAHVRSGPIVIGVLSLVLASCATMPTPQEANDAVLTLRQYEGWAWAVGIALIWADLVLPVPQTAVIAALGIIYGTLLGGLLGSLGLISSGLLGYGLMLTSARRFVQRFVGTQSLHKLESLFDQGGAWAIVLPRSLPYSVPEVMVFLAGLAGMRIGKFTAALSIGSVPTGFAFAAIGAGWADQPILALAVSYILPILLLPIALYRHTGRKGRSGL